MPTVDEFSCDVTAIDSPISWYDATSPEVSIIVLNFNKSDLTAECLRQVWANTRGKLYEVIVVDNGSSATEFRKIAECAGNFHLLRLPVNRFFGEGNNIGVGASRGRYVVFLNNDAFVTDDWLAPLISVLENEPNAGGAGAKLLYPDGRVQAAGAFIDDRGMSIQRGKNYTLESADLENIGIVDYCSAACFATSREIFDRVLGFDPSFEPAYYEDCDLCFKIASLDLFTYYCPNSVVHHIENATSSTFSKGLENVIEINREKFLARWGSYLSARANGEAASLPPLPLVRRRITALSQDRVAVFYSPYDLVPGGGERYLLTAASALQETHRVYVATDARYGDYRLDYLARELSLDASQISILTRSELPKLGPIDLFVHLGNRALPEVLGRGRRNFYICQFPFPCSSQELANNWGNLKSYHCIYVYSDFVRKVLCGKINAFQFDANIEIVAPPVPVEPMVTNRAPETSGRPIILNIGRFFTGGHNKRHDVLIEGIRLLTEAGVEADLHLVGTLHSNPDHVRHYSDLCRKAQGLPVSFHANAPPKIVRNLLSRANIYWHATGFEIDPQYSPEKCEHFGISILEAMSEGCVPFVVSNGGPTEFVRENETGFQYATLEELVTKTRAIIRDPARAAAVCERAMREARRFSERIFVDRWRKIAVA